MKSNELSFKLEQLELEASNIFNDLIKQKPIFNFLQNLSVYDNLLDYKGTDEEIEELLMENRDETLLPTIEIRSSLTGDVYDRHITSIDEHGIYGMVMDDITTKDRFEFSNISSLEQKLLLLNEMENLLADSK